MVIKNEKSYFDKTEIADFNPDEMLRYRFDGELFRFDKMRWFSADGAICDLKKIKELNNRVHKAVLKTINEKTFNDECEEAVKLGLKYLEYHGMSIVSADLYRSLAYSYQKIGDEKMSNAFYDRAETIDRKGYVPILSQNVIKHQIPALYHFTVLDNLESIMKNGLLSRAQMNRNNIKYWHNDSIRNDGCRDAVCLSIGFPNNSMFYKMRELYKEKDWILIKINPAVLWMLYCSFSWGNAGKKQSQKTYYPRRRVGLRFFEELFTDSKDFPNAVKRETLELEYPFPKYYTTNPQAEVLVFDSIPREYLEEIIFENDWEKYTAEDKYDLRIKCSADASLYSTRMDYKKYWKVERKIDNYG